MKSFARIRWAVVLGVPVFFLAAYLYAPYCSGGPAICVFRNITGLPCPGCGMTRAMCALARGDIVKAVQFHLFSIPLAAFFLAAAVVSALELRRGQPLRVSRLLRCEWALRTTAVLLVGYYLGRCIFWWHSGTFLSQHTGGSLLHSVLARSLRMFG